MDRSDDQTASVLNVNGSLKGKRWVWRTDDSRAALALSQETGLPDLVARNLVARGVKPGADVQAFLAPSLRSDLPNPSSLKDMDKAAARAADAIVAGESAAVFGDYDVDGATSSALLVNYFRALGQDLKAYIPDRIKEGYGPNSQAMKALADDGVQLVITVDCGTLAYQPLEDAAGLGLSVIVLDHHLAEPELPITHAVVNPNRIDDTSGQGALAAIGVTFLFCVAVNRELRARGWFEAQGVEEPKLINWLDLVALGTVADVVPLTGVNRAFVRQGLKVLAQSSNPGLKALLEVGGVREPPGSYHLGFVLGPRVNAGGRVGEAGLGTRLLTATSEAQAEQDAKALDHYNRERQTIEAAVTEAALQAATEQAAKNDNLPLSLVAGEGWHPGVIGIVASRVREKLDRPAFILALDGDVAKGSGRSIPGVDLGRAVTRALSEGLLVNGGGHAMAAGLTVERDKIDALHGFLCEQMAADVDRMAGERQLSIDGLLSPRAVQDDLLEMIEQAGPYGSGASEPRVVLSDVRVTHVAIMAEHHLRLTLAGNDGARVNAVSFRSVESEMGQTLLASKGKSLHVAGHLRFNHWQGRRSIQLIVEDAAPVGGAG